MVVVVQAGPAGSMRSYYPKERGKNKEDRDIKDKWVDMEEENVKM